MVEDTQSVGAAIAAALQRAAQRRKANRRLRVEVGSNSADAIAAFTIKARVAARTNAELLAQEGRGTRKIPWPDLDARASELVALVDAAIDEVEAAVLNQPSNMGRASLREGGFDQPAFEALAAAAYQAIGQSAGALLLDAPQRLSRRTVSEAGVAAAVRFAALAGLAGRMEEGDIVEILAEACRDLRRRCGGSFENYGPRRLNS